MAKGSSGQVVQVISTVVDVEFPDGELPEVLPKDTTPAIRSETNSTGASGCECPYRRK